MAFELEYRTKRANKDHELWSELTAYYEVSEIIMDTKSEFMKKESTGRTT